MSLGALEVGMGRYDRRRDACSGNTWPAGRRRAARVGRQRTELQREEGRRETKNNTELITQNLENQ